MSNWLFPDREEATDGPDGDGDAIDPADPAVDPVETDLDPEAVGIGTLRPGAVEAGTSVLVAGPPMTGKRRLLFDLVGGSDSRTGAFVTSKKPAQKMAAWFAATRPDPDAWDLRVGLHSLSTMLMYTDIKRLYQFMHAINTRVATVDAVGVYTLDVRSDAETADKIKQLFDSVVEVRSRDEGSKFRVRGGEFGPNSWTEF